MSADQIKPSAGASAETPNYKDTLFLPRTDFPMRAGLPKSEPVHLERWRKMDLYGRLRAQAADRPKFELHDGPPYANGHLHIGHALNKILKDFVVRSQQMLGADSRYIPGWDCHGLPIEWKIEEQFRARGQDKDSVPVQELRAECRKFAAGWVDVQRSEFQRLGITGDWDNPYLTMDFEAEAVIADEFMKFVMNGALYRGSKPVMWSVVEKTALAEAEVEYHEHQSHQIWVRFPVVHAIGPSGADSGLRGAKVVIWTTTPWTLPSNRAIAFNPSVSYGLYEVTGRPEECWAKIGERYLLADAMAEDVLTQARLDSTMWRRLRDVTADELDLLVCAHPLAGMEGADGAWDYRVPMLPGEHVTDDAGTGFVHTAPSHGLDDYVLGVRHGLEMTHNVTEDGSFRAELPLFGGATIFDHKGREKDANKRVMEALIGAEALLARGRMRHSYPHSWRSKAPLIFRNTPQWFVAIDRTLDDGMCEHGDTIRKRALESINELVEFTPPAGRNRLRSMIEKRPDWVVSRQRAWGVPLTCFVHRESGELLRDPAVNERIVDVFRREGADAWFAEGAKARFLGDAHHPDEWEKIDDILDVWFDSGSTHAFAVRDRGGQWPADVYLEGSDQHRGWFHSSILQGCGTRGRAPYKAVVTHGFTLDENGEKMSKSKGNTVSPEDVVKQYGADILRLWVATTDYGDDQRLGPNILKSAADSYRRLRNGFRYMLGALDGFTEDERLKIVELPPLERWILHRLSELDEEVRKGYAEYAFQRVYAALFKFVTSDLSALYFDLRKDVLYCDRADSRSRRACRTVIDLLFERLTVWFAPILVFTMEEVWRTRFPGEDGSVHLATFPDTPGYWRDPSLSQRVAMLTRLRRVGLGALEVERREKRIGSALETAPTIHIDDPELRALAKEVDFGEVLIASGATISDAPAPDGAFRMDEIPGVAVVVEMAQGQKCARCWKVLPDVGTHAHAGVCARCNEALEHLSRQ